MRPVRPTDVNNRRIDCSRVHGVRLPRTAYRCRERSVIAAVFLCALACMRPCTSEGCVLKNEEKQGRISLEISSGSCTVLLSPHFGPGRSSKYLELHMATRTTCLVTVHSGGHNSTCPLYGPAVPGM